MTLTALVIYDSVLFNRTGQVRRWAEAVERRFTANARQQAPVRSGELRAGIFGSVDRIGPVHLETVIESTAGHSLFVLQGTQGPIYSNTAWANSGRLVAREGDKMGGYLRLRPGNGHGVKFAVAVSGQSANNFFARAADLTAARHPSLRGFSPGYSF